MRFLAVLLVVLAVARAAEVTQLPAAPVGCVPAIIPANTVLYHGTAIGAFALNYFPAPVPAGAYNTGSANHPGGPGWFASTLGFAFHAGFRHLAANGNGYLFHYTANADIPVLNCDTHGNFYDVNGFLHGSGFAAGAAPDDVTGARNFCANMGDYLAGYIIQADAVRGQPEVILCQPDQWLNYVQRDVVAVTVHTGAAPGNTHPGGGDTLTFAHGGINMRLWWGPISANPLDDLINTATNNPILIESEAVARITSTAEDIGAVVAKLKVKKLTKPASVKKGDAAKDVKKDANDKAVKVEENGTVAFWDNKAVEKAKAAKKAPAKKGKFSARRLSALKPY